jgi:hypothetical protein
MLILLYYSAATIAELGICLEEIEILAKTRQAFLFALILSVLVSL